MGAGGKTVLGDVCVCMQGWLGVGKGERGGADLYRVGGYLSDNMCVNTPSETARETQRKTDRGGEGGGEERRERKRFTDLL